MEILPDYGLHLMSTGIPGDIEHNFYDFRLFSLTILGQGQYSTTVNMTIGGETFAMSLDFNQAQLDDILSKYPENIVDTIKKELTTDPSTPRDFVIDGNITFGVRARLGELQKVKYEKFVPFIVQEFI